MVRLCRIRLLRCLGEAGRVSGTATYVDKFGGEGHACLLHTGLGYDRVRMVEYVCWFYRLSAEFGKSLAQP